MEQTKNPKCNSCKSYWKPDETDILPSGLYAKSCKKCREYQKEKRERLKCVHNKRKSYCKECGGGSICEHNRQKSHCKECNFKLYLVHLHRTALKRCIKLSNLDKIKPSIDYLGCSVEYFMEYLKKKIDNFNQYSEIEMTWDNIHIDHIKPVSSFNLDDEEEFLSCCNYTNLQPLIAEINLNKSCKWSDKDNTYWTDNIKDKEHYDIYIPK